MAKMSLTLLLLRPKTEIEENKIRCCIAARCRSHIFFMSLEKSIVVIEKNSGSGFQPRHVRSYTRLLNRIAPNLRTKSVTLKRVLLKEIIDAKLVFSRQKGSQTGRGG
jgi:hypothetical protein